MFYSYVVAGFGIIFMVIMVVHVNSFVCISYSLLVGANVEESFNIRLGSVKALWRYALFEEKKILQLDEALLQEKTARFKMG